VAKASAVSRVPLDGDHVGGHPAEGTQPATTAEAEEGARRRTQGTLLDPCGDEDVGGRVTGTQLQRLVAVRRGQGAHGGTGCAARVQPAGRPRPLSTAIPVRHRSVCRLAASDRDGERPSPPRTPPAPDDARARARHWRPTRRSPRGPVRRQRGRAGTRSPGTASASVSTSCQLITTRMTGADRTAKAATSRPTRPRRRPQPPQTTAGKRTHAGAQEQHRHDQREQPPPAAAPASPGGVDDTQGEPDDRRCEDDRECPAQVNSGDVEISRIQTRARTPQPAPSAKPVRRIPRRSS
jgi:hypothetical protein